MTTLAIGLATLGVLGNPAMSSRATADQSTHPTPQPTPAPSRTPPTTSTHPPTANPPTSPVPQATTGPPTSRPQSARLAESKRWLVVLQALDIRRSRAFARSDISELDAVYTAGSSPWQSDRATITTYRGQRLRIEGLRMKIDNLKVETSTATTVVLRIVDRLVAGAVLNAGGQRTSFPPGTPTPRRITLTATATGWRISTITTT